MQIRALKLGTECQDRASGLTGTLTHWMMDMGQRIEYVFQPKGLNEEGQPLKRIALCAERLMVTESDFEPVQVPFEVLGTEATDKASGFTGMAVAFVRHINGCFHIEIQPQGMLAGKNIPIRSNEFDIRGCVGPMIPVLTVEQQDQSQRQAPSPMTLPERRSYDGEPVSRRNTDR
jgi:hypothetical protein